MKQFFIRSIFFILGIATSIQIGFPHEDGALYSDYRFKHCHVSNKEVFEPTLHWLLFLSKNVDKALKIYYQGKPGKPKPEIKVLNGIQEWFHSHECNWNESFKTSSGFYVSKTEGKIDKFYTPFGEIKVFSPRGATNDDLINLTEYFEKETKWMLEDVTYSKKVYIIGSQPKTIDWKALRPNYQLFFIHQLNRYLPKDKKDKIIFEGNLYQHKYIIDPCQNDPSKNLESLIKARL